MGISIELIDRLAHLSMLRFSEDEKKQLSEELEKMLGFINKLDEVDTSAIEPLLHMSSVPFDREDVIQNEVSKKDAFKNAPLHDEQFFLVPKVIKK